MRVTLAVTGGALALLCSLAARAHGPGAPGAPGELGELGELGALSGGAAQWPVWLAAFLWALAWLGHGLGAARRPPPAPRGALFHTALLLGALALFGPLDDWAARSTAGHMVQHMLLIVVVAPLLVLARPLPQWRVVTGRRLDAGWRVLQRATRRPLACALAHALAIWGWHAPVPYQLAVRDPLWHVLEHSSFLFTAWLCWWAVLRPGRRGVLPAALALLFTALHTGLLGALLTFAPVPLYGAASGGLADQQLAGLLMWIPGGAVYLLAALWAAGRWLRGAEPLGLARPGAPARGPGADAG